jgi:hypothetical protein
MTDPLLAGFVTFLTNPEFGLPFVLLTCGLLAWMLWEPAVDLFRSTTRLTFHPSEGESVSRTFFALQAHQYSRLVLEAQWRLDGVLRRRWKFDLRALPLVDPPRTVPKEFLRDLGHLRNDLVGTYGAARRKDGVSKESTARSPWRRASLSRFEGRLERFLRECEFMTARAERVPG